MHFTGEPCIQLPATHSQAITSLTNRLATSQCVRGASQAPSHANAMSKTSVRSQGQPRSARCGTSQVCPLSSALRPSCVRSMSPSSACVA
ncbi:hypothetical protein TP41_02100 [Xanthomonas euvesicatoria pv. citrumelonis]|nr:hypothetical protein TP41_02100 [Xanthomonas euvesicatoria pv. citrumelonis]